MKYLVGMLVQHPNRPQWGPGKIVGIEGDRVYVYFRDALEPVAKRIMVSVVPLQPCPQQSDVVLDALPGPAKVGDDWTMPTSYERIIALAVQRQLKSASDDKLGQP